MSACCHNKPENGKNDHSVKGWLCSRTGIATSIAVATLAFLIFEGHGAHLLGLVPYLLILACPLMHIFMMGGHGHHHDNDDEKDAAKPDEHKKHTGGCH